MPNLVSLTDPVLPHFHELSARDRIRPALPWVDEPDYAVHVHCEDDRHAVIGPLYRRQPPPDPKFGGFAFGIYEGSLDGGIQIARLTKKPNEDGIPIFLMDPLRGVPEETKEDVLDLTSKIVAFYQSRFGDPALRHGGTVLFHAKGVRNHIVGSYVFLNLAELERYNSPELRRARLLCALAHELAHEWWVYGAIWSDRSVARPMNEALATFLETEVVTAFGGQAARHWLRESHLYAAAMATGRSLAWLQRRGATFGGKAAGLLLTTKSIHSAAARLAVQKALEEVWDTAHREVVSLEHMREALSRWVSGVVGDAFVDAIKDPRPIAVHSRARLSRSAGRWVLTLKSDPTRNTAIQRKLDALHELFPRPDVASGNLAFEFESSEALGEAFSRMEGGLAVSKRLARFAWLDRHKFLDSVWTWAEQVIRHSPSMLRLFVASLAALALNFDDPTGFVGLAAFLDRINHRAALLARRLAGQRALSSGENSLRQQLTR